MQKYLILENTFTATVFGHVFRKLEIPFQQANELLPRSILNRKLSLQEYFLMIDRDKIQEDTSLVFGSNSVDNDVSSASFCIIFEYLTKRPCYFVSPYPNLVFNILQSVLRKKNGMEHVKLNQTFIINSDFIISPEDAIMAVQSDEISADLPDLFLYMYLNSIRHLVHIIKNGEYISENDSMLLNYRDRVVLMFRNLARDLRILTTETHSVNEIAELSDKTAEMIEQQRFNVSQDIRLTWDLIHNRIVEIVTKFEKTV